MFEKMIADASHAIGLGHRKPYTRHGRKFYRPYRNYFAINPDDPTWVEMERIGYAKHGEVRDHGHYQMTSFWLTRAGLDWLGEQLGMTIYDEED